MDFIYVYTYLISVMLSQWLALVVNHYTELFKEYDFDKVMRLTYIPLVNVMLIIVLIFSIGIKKNINKDISW